MKELNNLVSQQIEHCSEGGEGLIVDTNTVRRIVVETIKTTNSGTINDMKSFARASKISCDTCKNFKGCYIRQQFTLTFCSQYSHE